MVDDGGERGPIVVGDHHQVQITTIHAASPSIRCHGRADVRITTRDTSAPLIQITDRAIVRIETLGASAPRVEGAGTCIVILLARDRSAPHLEVTDGGQYRLVVQDVATPRCHDWPVDWQARPSETYVGQGVEILDDAAAAEATARAFVAEWRRCQNRATAAVRTGNAIPMVCDDAVDVRWRAGSVHIELDPLTGAAWCSHDAHDPHPFTESSRAACTRIGL